MVIELPRWKGKVAVVTGASAGIGAAICEQLVEARLEVVGIARRVEKVDDLAKKLSGKEGKLYGYKADVGVEEEVVGAFKWAQENIGPTSILVNNAGVARPTTLIGNDRINSDFACEYNTLHLECPLKHQVLRIVYAMYGRQNTTICQYYNYNNTNCRSSGSKGIVERECNGLQKCSVIARNEVFLPPRRDRCWVFHKYLDVQYECRIKNEVFNFDHGGYPLLHKYWGKYIPAGVSQFFPWWDGEGKCLRAPINQTYTRVDVKDLRDWILKVMKLRRHIDVICKKQLIDLHHPKKEIDNKIGPKDKKNGKATNSHDANYLLSFFAVGFLFFYC